MPKDEQTGLDFTPLRERVKRLLTDNGLTPASRPDAFEGAQAKAHDEHWRR